MNIDIEDLLVVEKIEEEIAKQSINRAKSDPIAPKVSNFKKK